MGTHWTMSPEARDRIAAARRGKKHSAETRAKIAATRSGHEVTPETRAKIGEALRARHRRDEDGDGEAAAS